MLQTFQEYYIFNWYDDNYMSSLENLIPLRLLPGADYFKREKKSFNLIRSPVDGDIANRNQYKYPFHYAWVFCQDRPFQITNDIFFWTEYVGDTEYENASKEEQEDVKRQLSLANINSNGYYVLLRRLPFVVYLTYGKLFYPTKTIATLIEGRIGLSHIEKVSVNRKLYLKRDPKIKLWNETAKDISFFTRLPENILGKIFSTQISDERYINYAKCFTDERYDRLRKEAKAKYEEDDQNGEHFRQYILTNDYRPTMENLSLPKLTAIAGTDYDLDGVFNTLMFNLDLNDLPKIEILLRNGHMPTISPFIYIRSRFDFEVPEEQEILDIERILDMFVEHGYEPKIQDKAISILNQTISKTHWGNFDEETFNRVKKYIIEETNDYISREAFHRLSPFSNEELRLLWDNRPYLDILAFMDDPLEIINLEDLSKLYANNTNGMDRLLRAVYQLFGLERNDVRWLDIIEEFFMTMSDRYDDNTEGVIDHLSKITNIWEFTVEGKTLMDYFIEHGYVDLVNDLVNRGAPISDNLLVFLNEDDFLVEMIETYISRHRDARDKIKEYILNEDINRVEIYSKLISYTDIDTLTLIRNKNISNGIYNSEFLNEDYKEMVTNYIIDMGDVVSYRNLGIKENKRIIERIVEDIEVLYEAKSLTDNPETLRIIEDFLSNYYQNQNFD